MIAKTCVPGLQSILPLDWCIGSCPLIYNRSSNRTKLSCIAVIQPECLPFHLSPDHDNTSCTANHDVSLQPRAAQAMARKDQHFQHNWSEIYAPKSVKVADET